MLLNNAYSRSAQLLCWMAVVSLLGCGALELSVSDDSETIDDGPIVDLAVLPGYYVHAVTSSFEYETSTLERAGTRYLDDLSYVAIHRDGEHMCIANIDSITKGKPTAHSGYFVLDTEGSDVNNGGSIRAFPGIIDRDDTEITIVSDPKAASDLFLHADLPLASRHIDLVAHQDPEAAPESYTITFDMTFPDFDPEPSCNAAWSQLESYASNKRSQRRWRCLRDGRSLNCRSGEKLLLPEITLKDTFGDTSFNASINIPSTGDCSGTSACVSDLSVAMELSGDEFAVGITQFGTTDIELTVSLAGFSSNCAASVPTTMTVGAPYLDAQACKLAELGTTNYDYLP